MNINLVKSLLVASLLGSGSFAMANAVTVKNTGQAPVNMSYQIAYADPGQAPVYGPVMSIPNALSPGQTALVGFSMNDHTHQYRLATFIPVNVNGHELPNPYPYTAQSCAVKTTMERRQAELSVAVVLDENGHGHIDCSKYIG